MTEDNALAVAREFVAAINSGDIDRVKALFAEDLTWWLVGSLPLSGEYKGRDAVMKDFLGTALPLFQSLQVEATNVFASGDQALVEWKADGVAANGREYKNDYAFVLRVRGNQLVSVREYVDTERARDILFS